MAKIKKLKPRAFEDVDLREHAIHVSYELQMLLYTAEHLQHGHSSPETEPEGKDRNMCLESFLLHFRNLRHFLCPGDWRHDEDVFGSDFLQLSEPTDVADRSKLVDEEERLRINAMLAHVSTTRKEYIKLGQHKWPTAAMAVRLLDAFKTFAGKLAPHRRTWFPNATWIDHNIGVMIALADEVQSDPR